MFESDYDDVSNSENEEDTNVINDWVSESDFPNTSLKF